jgi:hypothetical protein
LAGQTGCRSSPPSAPTPTRIPGNQPAFRGVNNKPGQPIKAPAIKSSANHPDRKTNVLIPYARVCPVEFPADLGRTDPGDVLFVSKTRPGVPGYAHARESRVCGVDALNRWLSPMFWDTKNEAGDFRYILTNPKKLADDWRKVPIFQEWTLDGICLSNDEKNLNRASMSMQRDGQLWNIGIQGPCMINNGYVEERSTQNGIAMMQQGQVARQSKLFAPGYMDHRVERFGQDKVTVSQQYDFAADYQGPQYHLYPMQMFGRDVKPLHDLYIGLVATEYKLSDADAELLEELARGETATELFKATSDEARNPKIADLYARINAVKDRQTAEAKEKLKDVPGAFTAKTAFDKMGWWDNTKGRLRDKNDDGEDRPESFAVFRYVLFTSAHMWELAEEDEVETWAPPGEDHVKRTKRQKLGKDPFDDSEQRRRDFKKMVGAWHLGKVLDTKAGKMPYFEGGPVETGYRLTVNLSQGWCDWRALRRQYTPAGSKVQIGMDHEDKWPKESMPAVAARESITTFQWPTVYDQAAAKLAEAGGGRGDAGEEAYRANINVPVSLDEYGSLRASDVNNFEYKEYVETQRVEYQKAYYATGTAGAEAGTSTEATASAIFAARLAKLPERPVLTGPGDALRVAQLSLARIETLIAPATASEMAGNGPSLNIANFVTSASSANSTARAAAPAAPIRRRASNTPEASPDRTGAVAAAAAAAAPPAAAPVAAAPSLAPVIEAPSAPSAPSAPQAAAAGKKRRAAGASSDVFSSIFGSGGDTGAAPQPLNPAHRSDGAAGASGASTGRSYQRRGKGGSGGSKE